MSMAGLSFAYYCSGHGFGHATRVSAFASHLLSLTPQPTIYIVSSAPKHVFNDSVALGAHYKHSEIDPVVVQPLAYRVDRQKSVDVLKAFLEKKDTKLEDERAWLVDTKVDCVLSDAAFLGCLAANAAGLPSILITNFTFDSVYSYLSAPLVDGHTSSTSTNSDASHLHPPNVNILVDLIPDIPVPQSVLAPLVEQIHAGYRCADLLVLLPGFIPIPSFSVSPKLPSPDWVDWTKNGFNDDVIRHLSSYDSNGGFHDAIPFASASKPKTIPRSIMLSPLLVRSPSGTCINASSCTPPSLSPYTLAGRRKLLSSIGIPTDIIDQKTTKILVVSFGGQVFRRVGSRNTSKNASRSGSPLLRGSMIELPSITSNSGSNQNTKKNAQPTLVIPSSPQSPSPYSAPSISRSTSGTSTSSRLSDTDIVTALPTSTRLATHSHIFIPGAPPASKISGSFFSSYIKPYIKHVFYTETIPPFQPRTPQETNATSHATESPSNLRQSSGIDYMPQNNAETLEEETSLLPDETWIAIVCGVSKEQWNTGDGDDGLPDGFYVAPKDVYMPDLTAVADVLLGKLGYGTVSECVDNCTPFVYGE
ncbi:hypothetical protein PILCRDRAFT_403319 [Piloderma croceum F 1598]|uniref:L-arabinokinase n=1 Tax=Piloderma croceum (strain F 1598) TaxID=765440 RepID=A0A0C3BD22_PILCF|nr:hypothetical protein PILCRDRAFT_403319 [Piloderma croceum F 1598]